VELVSRFPRGRVWLFALSPATALYFNLNWDMWAVLLMIAALLLFVHERDGLAALVLAATTWSKFFPAVLLPFVFLDRMQRQGWRTAGKVVGVFTLTSVALNAPLLVLKPSAWWHFFEYNASREGDLNLWTLVFGLPPSAVSELNALSAVFTLAGIGALLVLQWRGPAGTCSRHAQRLWLASSLPAKSTARSMVCGLWCCWPWLVPRLRLLWLGRRLTSPTSPPALLPLVCLRTAMREGGLWSMV
jgi:hypothetical protein